MVTQLQQAICVQQRIPGARLNTAERLEIQHLIAEGHENREIEFRTGVSYSRIAEIRRALNKG
ncbi:hypothetical protein GCM10009125_28000 [Castellaniella daejeonensis]|uniref:Helix-turn-helix domain-containing protein n=2 Tax=Castellaniella daejeonensis TaxID=659013 RepID=A0ABN0U3J9_9BURK